MSGGASDLLGGGLGTAALAANPFMALGGGLLGSMLDGSGTPAGQSGQLPDLGIHPRFYDPNSFVARHAVPGSFNAMADALAGLMYNPVLRNPPARTMQPGIGSQLPAGRGMLPPGVRRVAP